MLEIISAPATAEKAEYDLSFSTTGIPLSITDENNSCLRAIQLVRQKFPGRLPAMQVHLHKNIPAGAGLGGGSADGAFTLTLLNKLYRLGQATDELAALALQLGSDCPFFIYNKPCYATGRGEIMEPVPLDLSAYRLILINPGIHISTAAAFEKIKLGVPKHTVKDIIKQPIETWKHHLQNDFELPVFHLYPEIMAVRDQLYAQGAVYAAMSGTGSTVYGIFSNTAPSPALSFPAHYFIRQTDSLPPSHSF